MIEIQFFWQNAHFALNLFAALVFFAVAWLYFDASVGRRNVSETLKILGFFIISISFVIHATFVEQIILTSPIFGASLTETIASILRLVGYVLLIAGLIRDPLQKRPAEAKNPKNLIAFSFPAMSTLPGVISLILLPISAAGVGLLYLRRATVGLEHHLRPVGFAFFILSIHELFSLASLFRQTNNVAIFNLVAPFAPLWVIEHLILLVSIVILGRWVFGYLLKRIQSQLFMILTSSVLVIFLMTTIVFTGLLLENLKSDALAHLTTDVDILQYSIDSKKAETLSDAQNLANSPETIQAIINQDKKALKNITTSTLLSKKESLVVLTATDGAVLARGEDPDRVGESVSSDPLFKKVLDVGNVSSVITTEGVLAPSVSVRSGAPIMNNGTRIGVVMLGTDIDNAFVDGIKKATGLDASIYGGNIRSATTFIAADGKSRWVGIKEETPAIKKSVLSDAHLYTGSVNILNTNYLAAYAPLKDADNNPVGMLFVGEESVGVLQAAGRAIEFTFLMSVGLLLVSVVASFFVARYIARQIH